LYWRKKDIKEFLGDTIREIFTAEVAEPTCEMIQSQGAEKALEWLSENSEADCWIEEQPLNGSIDTVLMKKIERESAFDGPHLELKEGGKGKGNGKRTMKSRRRSDSGCRNFIDGVEVH